MFPQYEALAARLGNTMARPIDLWSQDWPTVSLESPLQPPELQRLVMLTRTPLVTLKPALLMLMRGQLGQGAKLADLCASLAASANARKSHREGCDLDVGQRLPWRRCHLSHSFERARQARAVFAAQSVACVAKGRGRAI